MIRRELLRFIFGAIGTVTGAVVMMSVYINVILPPDYQKAITAEERERANWIALMVGLSGSFGGAGLSLIALALFSRPPSEEEKAEEALEFARQQLRKANDPVSSSQWAEVVGTIEAHHQPKKHLLPASIRKIW